MNESRIYRVNDNSGFRIYKLDDYNARCMVKKAFYDIYLEKIDEKVYIIQNSGNPNLTSFSSSMDLFDYNNDHIFSSEKKNYLGEIILLFMTIMKKILKK